ncbi:MAG: hypothetical protein KAT58_12795 [candidate division Zixibacteria bacterium]|nr:hypothetical protein [candidate division Zixibacteria bacterium]
MIASKRTPYATAAAAGLILVLIGFWPSGSGSGIAWADVVEQLNEVRTVIGLSTTEEVSASGTRTVYRTKLYFKDPAMSRTEFYAVPRVQQAAEAGTSPPANAVESIVIIVRGQDQSTEMHLYPQRKAGQRTTHLFSGNMLDLRAGDTFNLATDGWTSLRRITSDQTREIGERRIDGMQTVGFEAAVRELFDTPRIAPPEGVVRVWAAKETAVPVEVDVEFRDKRGQVFKTRIENIQWNVPLSDDLFDVSILDGWEIHDSIVRFVEFSKTFLRSGVTLRIGPKGGPPVITERGIQTIHSGRSVEELTGDKPKRLLISIALTPAVQERLKAFTTEHLGDRVVIDFNGEFQSEITIGGVIREGMQLDISPLGKTLAQFEDDYLTSRKPTDPD